LGTCAAVSWHLAQKRHGTCELVSGYLDSRLGSLPQLCQSNCRAAAGQLCSIVRAVRINVMACVKHHHFACAAAPVQLRSSVGATAKHFQCTFLRATWHLHSNGSALEMQRRQACAASLLNLRFSVGALAYQLQGTCVAASGQLRSSVREPSQNGQGNCVELSVHLHSIVRSPA
jgi:hypothetical protein